MAFGANNSKVAYARIVYITMAAMLAPAKHDTNTHKFSFPPHPIIAIEIVPTIATTTMLRLV